MKALNLIEREVFPPWEVIAREREQLMTHDSKACPACRRNAEAAQVILNDRGRNWRAARDRARQDPRSAAKSAPVSGGAGRSALGRNGLDRGISPKSATASSSGYWR